jgi:hypothetical protein
MCFFNINGSLSGVVTKLPFAFCIPPSKKNYYLLLQFKSNNYYYSAVVLFSCCAASFIWAFMLSRFVMNNSLIPFSEY